MIDPKTLYDDSDRDSIFERANLLLDKNLRMILSEAVVAAELAKPPNSGKGGLGTLVEWYHFGIKTNSLSEPDFLKAGIELKTTPLKRTSLGLRSKERLVLNIIDYCAEDGKSFETSSFWRKNKLLLLMFFIWKADQTAFDYIFRDIRYWDFQDLPGTDLAIIRQDWKIIQDKIRRGVAHEISEGDTMYLGACTKGSTAEKSFRKQPHSKIKAKQRAYSLKSRYVNLMVDPKLLSETEPVIKDPDLLRKRTIEEIVIDKFKGFYGMSVDQIVKSVKGQHLNPNAKNFYADLTKLILKIDPKKEIEEFEKADVMVRTSRLLPTNLPKESISFPYFQFTDVIVEDWMESPFKDYLETKFLFVFFRFEDDDLILRKAKFWNMPYRDIEEAKKVWEQTRELLSVGGIVKAISRKGIRSTYFPKKSENRVSHVRPHARNALDAVTLPVPDKLTGAREYTKHCFWLNDEYVRDEIFLK